MGKNTNVAAVMPKRIEIFTQTEVVMAPLTTLSAIEFRFVERGYLLNAR